MPGYFDDEPDGSTPAPDPEAAAFGDALRRTAESLPLADTRALVRAGYDRGRTLRRRRTAAISAGVAVCVLAGAGGLLAAGAGGGGGKSRGVATAPPSGTPAVRTTGPARTGGPAVSARQMTDLLAAALPGGRISGRTGRGTDDHGPVPYAQVVYDDGHGAAAVEVSVDRYASEPGGCEPDPAPGTTCTSTHVHGGTLAVTKGYEFSDRRVGTKAWDAVFLRPGGAEVEVTEWNAPAEKGAPVSRPDPPLDAARLGALATDPRWQQVLAAVPAPVKPVKGAPGATSALPGENGRKTLGT